MDKAVVRDAQMREENEMDGYAKIDQYNTRTVKRIAGHYRQILVEIGRAHV